MKLININIQNVKTSIFHLQFISTYLPVSSFRDTVLLNTI